MSRNTERSSRRRNIASAVVVVRYSCVAAALVLLMGRSSFSLRLVSPHLKIPVGRLSSILSKMTSSSSSRTPKLLEVEQKFPFSNRSHLEERLRREGFEPTKDLTMVDWYFDRCVHNNDLNGYYEMPLVRRDHWLRYRESITNNGNGNDGRWQLKRGNQGSGGGGTTVYEEVEGMKAVEIVHSLLREQPSPSSRSEDTEEFATRTFDGHPIPVLPIPDCDVVPFARIVTHRVKWKQHLSMAMSDNPIKDEEAVVGSISFSDLVVDLDTTPDGYAIGEVEAVVQGEDCSSIEAAGAKEAAAEAAVRNDRAVAQARACIQKFLASLLEDSDGDSGSSSARNRRPPMGKLEQFLSQNRPGMYKACVESGVIPKPPPASTTI